MNDIIASGTIHSIKSIFQKKTEHNVIIDPFSCLIKLSLLRFLDSGTKISINQNSICFNSPTYVPTKIDISLTLLPIQSRSDISKIFNLQQYASGSLLKGGFW